jgi:uncharacterized Zn finger protein (UPF0148 family)
MSCDCYKIGGPFIAEDPDCPIHGREAQAREREAADRDRGIQEQLDEICERLYAIEDALGLNK